jgi:hypothetical protein
MSKDTAYMLILFLMSLSIIFNAEQIRKSSDTFASITGKQNSLLLIFSGIFYALGIFGAFFSIIDLAS